MKTVLVTGAKGFIGKNLVVALKRRADVDVIEHDLDSPIGLLEEGLAKADVIYHLAGVNRPERVEEFAEGNFDLTRQICDALRRPGQAPAYFSSSVQAALDNPYGLSSATRKSPCSALESGGRGLCHRLLASLANGPGPITIRGGHLLSIAAICP